MSIASAQTAAKNEVAPKFVTVPITLDQNRVIIDVYLPLPDGTTKRVRGWVDTGDSELWMSQRVAGWMGLGVSCDGQMCSGTATATPKVVSLEITIGGMKIFLSAMGAVKVPALRPTIAAGMSAEIKIPSSVLRNYDVLINFPDREFSIGQPGSLKFKGVKTKMLVNANTGFIRIPSKIEKKSYNLGLDVGSSISFLSDELFEKLAAAHPDWPHMTGAVGPANVGELGDDEPKWKLMRVDRLQYGPLYFTDVAVAEFDKSFSTFFEKQAGGALAGLIGANALMNYRIGLDYAHSTAYFDLGSTFKFPEFDVVGLIVRPEEDTRFTILGVADFDGKPSVPEVLAGDHLIAVDGIPVPDSTMGQVWSLLEGTPGQERKLTVERNGKEFTVTANVRHFLGEAEEKESQKKSGRK
ncbi:MAG TPA: PDZ domain-containing protein [Candidatus Sulfotelmatobacter sp.]|nr:PDZ domain-containing protein [Candidatus Sulfotelmatobacter sp.]